MDNFKNDGKRQSININSQLEFEKKLENFVMNDDNLR